jgi:hypothetical protein
MAIAEHDSASSDENVGIAISVEIAHVEISRE